MKSISSDEINLLIQHYLQELGYSHAAFAFGCESQIPLKDIAKRKVQPGSLVYLIQKGIMFAHMEAAAEKALDDPSVQFSRQLNSLRSNLKQSTDLVDELCTATRRMKVFPAADQTEIRPFYLNNQSALFLEGHRTPAISCAWSKNSEYMATASTSGSIIIWRYELLQNKSCIVHHAATIRRPESAQPSEEKDVTALCWSNCTDSDLLLASGDFSGGITVYKRGEESLSISHHKSPIVSLQFSEGRNNLLSASSGGSVFVLSVEDLMSSPTVVCHWEIEDEIVGAVWIGSSSVLIASSKGLYLSKEEKQPELIFSSKASIVQLIANESNDIFIIGDNAGNINAFNVHGNKIYSSLAHKGTVCCLSSSKVNPLVFVSGGCDCSVCLTKLMLNSSVKSVSEIVNNELDAKVAKLEAHSSPVYCVAFDPLGKFIASADKETINIWSAKDRKLTISYNTTCATVNLMWSPCGRFLTICLFSGEVAVIDFDQLC